MHTGGTNSSIQRSLDYSFENRIKKRNTMARFSGNVIRSCSLVGHVPVMLNIQSAIVVVVFLLFLFDSFPCLAGIVIRINCENTLARCNSRVAVKTAFLCLHDNRITMTRSIR